MTSTEVWIEAGKILARHPTAKVKCPECGEADLAVFDTRPSDDHIERHIRCPKCGAYNALFKSSGGI